MIGTLLALAVQATAPPAPMPAGPDPALARLVGLFDEVCLRAFPIDGAVDKLMAAKGARALTADEVRVTFNDDPGRGWLLADGDRQVQVMLELPPYHACSVRRRVAGGTADLSGYRALADRFEAEHPRFAPGSTMEQDVGDQHVHGVTEARPLPGGGAQTLMVIDQRTIDPATKVPGGEYEYRFVHQIMSPGAR